MLRRLSGVALGLAAATTAGALAQTPTFRSGVDLLTIDVTAIDRDGRPIPDLAPDDVQLFVDGQPRRVVAAQFVGRIATSAERPATAPDHFTSNEYDDSGRLVVAGNRQSSSRSGAQMMAGGGRSQEKTGAEELTVSS
jgi:hypothetical protein